MQEPGGKRLTESEKISTLFVPGVTFVDLPWGTKMTSTSKEITQLLIAWNQGDERARDELMTFIYGELRRLARGHLRRERINHTLQPTALVHEAFLRLVDQSKVNWQN